MTEREQEMWDFVGNHLRINVTELFCPHTVKITLYLYDVEVNKREVLASETFEVGDQRDF